MTVPKHQPISGRSDTVVGDKPPTHEVVYRRLRDKVLFGELAPGEAVTIQGLVDALATGMTPVREAIRRMISEGALVFQGNRRVTVPSLTVADIDEIVYVRKSIECELAFRAASRISPVEVEALAEIDSALDAAIDAGDVHGYLVHNYNFHATLYGYAKAPVLTDIAERMWLRFGPSMRVICGSLENQDFPDRHKDILEALRRRDGELASLAMERDVSQGMNQIRTGIETASDSIDSA